MYYKYQKYNAGLSSMNGLIPSLTLRDEPSVPQEIIASLAIVFLASVR